MRPLTELTDQDADDILATAFEGGSNYWFDAIMNTGGRDGDLYYAKSGFCWAFYDCDTEQEFDTKDYPKYQRLTMDTLKRGFMAWVKFVGDEHQRFTNGEDTQEILEEIDAGDADSIVQLAVFGELVFG